MNRAGHTKQLTQDPLSAIAPLLRVRPQLQEVCRFASPWNAVHEAEPPGWAHFHIVTKGRCLLERPGGETLRLDAGNVLLLPHGGAHVVRSARRGGRPGMPMRLEYNNAIRIKTNTRDESDTELICGRLRFEAVPESFPIAALPETIVLMLGLEKVLGPMRTLVQTIDEELEAARPGAAAVATDLASALFVMMLRGHFEQTASSSDLMKLLASPQSARAVTAMLAAPAHHWTLDELAVQSHVSRATLVRIFRSAIGIAPLTFLAELRLGLARQRLSSTSASLAEVATAVGYESASAFARAFQRRFGISPGKLRGLPNKPAV